MLLDPDAAWLVSWDDAVIAPRERDLVLVVGGLPVSADVAPQEVRWFADGYGQLDPDPGHLYYYACIRAMGEIIELADLVLDVEHLDATGRAATLEILGRSLSPDGIGRLMPDRWSWPPP